MSNQSGAPDYRALYEGSQHSLTGLSANQANTLGRLGRIRQGIAKSLKNFFPVEFAEAERSLGKRLSSDDIDEDLLIVFLESFLQMATKKAPASASDIARLRAGLSDIGVDTTGAFTVSDLASAIERHAGPVPQLGIESIFVPGAWTPPGEVRPVARPLTPHEMPTPIAAPPAPTPPAPTPPAPSPRYSDDTDSGYDEEYYSQDPAPANEDHYEEPPAPAPVVVVSPPDAPAHQAPSSLDDLFAEQSPVAKAPRKTRVRPDTQSGPWAGTVPESPLKPRVPSVPGPRARPSKRTPRVGATSPLSPPMALDPDVRNQLLAAVCVARPVFSADLVNLVNSAEIVAAWEEECSRDPELPVRFISPKPRHKMRGSLIIPQDYLRTASPEFQKSLWARVITQYKGAKAYELGVLLHRYNEEVVSDLLGAHVALFHLNRPQGLIGVLCVVEASLSAGGATREALVATLETLMRERLVQIAVLTTNAELTDSIAAVISEEATLRKWAPTAPVTLSKSWDFTYGTSAALPLLGV